MKQVLPVTANLARASLQGAATWRILSIVQVALGNQTVKFQNNFMLCTGILHYFGIKI